MYRPVPPLGWTRILAVAALSLGLVACGDMPEGVDNQGSTFSDAGDAIGSDVQADTVGSDTQPGGKCTEQNTCRAKGLHCDPASGACVVCLSSSDCGEGATCTDHQCTVASSCDDEAPTCESPGALRICDPDSHSWLIIACSGATVCSNGACLAAKCPPNQPFCEGGTALQCSSDGLSTTFVQDCAAMGKACVAGACQEQVCAPFQQGCQGTAVTECSPDGTQQQVIFDCAMYGAMCVAGNCQKLPCAPGETGCLDKQIVKCDAAGYTPVTDCAAQGKTCEGGGCVDAVCMPGEATCSGTSLMYCNNSGSAWQMAADCSFKPGGSGTCLNGNCVDMPCLPGGVGCEGTTAVQCGAAGEITPLEDCNLKGLVCIAGACQTPICQPNESLCDGSKVMYCDGGKAWIDGGDCAAYGMGACYNGQCIKTPCPPGGLGCAGMDLVQCDTAGSWTVVDPCGSKGKVCSGGACVDPVCQPGMIGCNGTMVMGCSPDGMAWTEQQDCAWTGQFCDQGQCVSQICAAGTTGCFGNATATCAPDGMGWSEAACGSQVCSSGVCTAPKCVLPKSYPADAVWMHWIEPTPGTGCDMNGDGKVDNALQKMIGIALAGGQGPFAGGKPFALALVANSYTSSGAPFDLQILPSLPKAGSAACAPFDTGVQSCDLVPDVSAYQLGSSATTCPAVSGWLDAKVTGSKLEAGGPGATIALPMTAAPTSKTYVVKGARLQASVPTSGSMVPLPLGTLCGWLTKADLDEIIDNLPASFYGGGGLDAAGMKSQLYQAVKPDFDSDGNGSLDAYTFGLDFAGDPVTLTPAMP